MLTINKQIAKLRDQIIKDPTNLKLKKKFHELEYKSVTTRAEALRRGWSIYNDKNRCENGHFSDRRTSNGKCIKCSKYKASVPDSFVTHSPIFNVKDAEVLLNEILKEINVNYPKVKLVDILKEKIKLSPELYKYFIKAPDSMVSIIDEMSVKSIRG